MAHYYAETVADIDWKTLVKKIDLSKVFHHGDREAENFQARTDVKDIDWKATLKRSQLSKVFHHGDREAKSFQVKEVFANSEIEVIQ